MGPRGAPRTGGPRPSATPRLAAGPRVNPITPPLALDGPCLSIRRFGRHVVTQEEMLQYKTVTAGMLRFLGACVQAQKKVLIFGGTGARTTTHLNAPSRFITAGGRGDTNHRHA